MKNLYLKAIFLSLFTTCVYAQYNQNPYNPANKQTVKLKNGNILQITRGFCPICQGSGRCMACKYSYPCQLCNGTMQCTVCGGVGGSNSYVVFSADGQYCAQADQYGNAIGPWRNIFVSKKMREPDRNSRSRSQTKGRKWFDCCTNAPNYTGKPYYHTCPKCGKYHEVGTHAHFVNE